MPGIERDGEELPRLSPGVGCDSTAQGDKVRPKLPDRSLKTGYMEFAMAGNYSTIGIQLVLTRQVSYC